MNFGVINLASSAETKLVTGVANRKIRVTSYQLVAGGTVTVQFTSGAAGGATTALTGAMGAVAGTPIHVPVSPWTPGDVGGYFESNPGEDLNLKLGGNVQVSGHFSYEIVS
jgi:hypothetical protein